MGSTIRPAGPWLRWSGGPLPSHIAKDGAGALTFGQKFWRLLLTASAVSPLNLLAAAAPDPSLVTSIFSPESTPAYSIMHLADFVLLITVVVFVFVFCLIVYAVAHFRRRSNDDGTEPPQVYGSNPIEMAWTIVPILIVGVLALVTARVIHEIQDHPKPSTALDVQVIGHQFWWEIRYPTLGIVAANEIHVPVSRPDRPSPTFLDLRSADVAHSFWVPRLAGKTEVIPNKKNTMWIEPNRTGLFLGQCAEFCGTQHALMLIRVYVDTPEQFDLWVQQQKTVAAVDSAHSHGRRVFEQNACINCHALNGTEGTGRFGPDLTHLMSRATLAAGAMDNTSANLRAWVLDPNHFKPGVLMPAMNLNSQDLDSLVGYLLTLK
jgi:cytochrome c oxidase subunit 2